MPFEGEVTPELLAVQLDELRHRLRNHLQNMTSLISLQIRRAQHPETIEALEDLRVRFATLTSVYIDLDNASDREIALEHFIPDLVRRVGELYDPKTQHFTSCRMTPMPLPHNRASVLGQIVVELVMNIYRHAFMDRLNGRIEVVLERHGEHAVLSISDDGPGLREPDPARVHLGFRIVDNLARALGGTFERASRDGFEARIRFPLDTASKPG
jgi:two-component system, sensor histidine kinase PdtaS